MAPSSSCGPTDSTAGGGEPGQTTTTMTTNSVKDPTLRIRLVFFSCAASQAFLIALARCRKIGGLIDLIYQTVPGVAAIRQDKPKLNWRILLQETEVMGNAKRWTVVARGDGSEYGTWYAHNVPDGAAKTVKIEVHVPAGEAEDGAAAEGQGNFLEELQEMGNGKTRHASRLTSPYRQLKVEVQGQTTMRGVPTSGSPRFEDARIDEIREAIIDKCFNAKYYEEAPSTHSWLPPRTERGRRRGWKHRPNKYKKMRGRWNKRARTDDGPQDTMTVDEEIGRR